MKHLKKLEEEVSAWPAGGIGSPTPIWRQEEFRFASAEIGHVHVGGVVDIRVPRSIRDALLAEGLAEEHHPLGSPFRLDHFPRSERG